MGHDRPQLEQVARAREFVGGPLVTAIEGGDVKAAADAANKDFQDLLDGESSNPDAAGRLGGPPPLLTLCLLGLTEANFMTTYSAAAPLQIKRTSAVERWADRHIKWLFIGPAVGFVVALIAFPIGYTIYLSLTDAAGSISRPKSSLGSPTTPLADRHRPVLARRRAGLRTSPRPHWSSNLVLGMRSRCSCSNLQGQGFVRVLSCCRWSPPRSPSA